MNPMSNAPKDGTRILLYYRPSAYINQTWVTRGTKWEECRWVSDKVHTGNEPHWESWCGVEETFTTNHIEPKDCVGWLPLP